MLAQVDEILTSYDHQDAAIVQILGEVQRCFNYLPREVLDHISLKLKVPLSKIYSIATFYAAFSLNPRGKHMITVCKGTACFVRGVANVIERLEDQLGIQAGETTPDLKFTLETVNCLGACALAPIVVVDGDYHGQTSVQKVDTVLDKYQNLGSDQTEQ